MQKSTRVTPAIQERLEGPPVLSQTGEAAKAAAVQRGRILHPLHQRSHGVIFSPQAIAVPPQTVRVTGPCRLEHGRESGLGFFADSANPKRTPGLAPVRFLCGCDVEEFPGRIGDGGPQSVDVALRPVRPYEGQPRKKNVAPVAIGAEAGDHACFSQTPGFDAGSERPTGSQPVEQVGVVLRQ